MSFVFSNIAVFAIASVLIAFSWVWGGTRGDLLLSFVPWLSFILIEVMFAFPQRMAYEAQDEARLRVWRSFSRDRLTWACVGFLILLAVPFVNPGLRFLPWCANRVAHLNVYLWFFPSLLAMLAARHSLRRHGKRLLAKVLVWNGVALAAFGFIQVFSGASGPFWIDPPGKLVFFASFAYPNMAGDFFASLTFLAIGLWRRQLEDTKNIDFNRYSTYQIVCRRHYPLIAVGILYFAALNTLSRSAILLATSGVVFLFVVAGVAKMKKLHRAQRVRFSAMLLLTVISITLFALLFTPESVRKELGTLNAECVLDRMTGKVQYHTSVASALIADYPAFGCGGWGYAYLSPEKIPPEIRRGFIHKDGTWSSGTANVHNDYLQFICEHGLVGFSLLVLIVVLAVMPAAKRWKRLAKSVSFSQHTGLPWPQGFFCFPPMGVAIYTAAVASLIHAFGDCPFRSPAILSLFFVELVIVEGYLPRSDEERN